MEAFAYTARYLTHSFRALNLSRNAGIAAGHKATSIDHPGKARGDLHGLPRAASSSGNTFVLDILRATGFCDGGLDVAVEKSCFAVEQTFKMAFQRPFQRLQF